MTFSCYFLLKLMQSEHLINLHIFSCSGHFDSYFSGLTVYIVSFACFTNVIVFLAGDSIRTLVISWNVKSGARHVAGWVVCIRSPPHGGSSLFAVLSKSPRPVLPCHPQDSRIAERLRCHFKHWCPGVAKGVCVWKDFFSKFLRYTYVYIFYLKTYFF